jgi:2-(1,2-epoxy-1,2-dihydrophenyl)acetyl-CoA isomerase
MSSSEQTGALVIERAAGVVSLTLNRPQRRNAIDVPLWQALTQALAEIGASGEDRAVVLTGAAGTFCAGGDLSGSQAGGAEPAPDSSEAAAPDPHGAAASDSPEAAAPDPHGAAVRVLRGTVNAACLALHRLPQPVVAAVEGTAAGAGANLAFGCDLVVAGASARFGEVFVRRALPVDSGGSWLLPRLVGLQRAKQLALLGDWIGADDAARIGLVNRIVEDGRALAEAQALARRLAESSPTALAWIKRSLNASFEASFEQALETEAKALAECAATPEFTAALRAFFARER